MNLFDSDDLPVLYGCVANLTNPSSKRYILNGSKQVTSTYILISYLNPLNKWGLERYFETK